MDRYRIKVERAELPGAPVMYLATRDFRVADNYSLVYAQELALRQKTAFVCVVCLEYVSMYRSQRHYKFFFEGLRELKSKLKCFNVKMIVLETEAELFEFMRIEKIGNVVYDFMPLKKFQSKILRLRDFDEIGLVEVDSHNLLPARFLSEKQEYGAVVLRKRIKESVESFLFEKIVFRKQERDFVLIGRYDKWSEVESSVISDEVVKGVDWILGGHSNAIKLLNDFCENKIFFYEQYKNNPMKDVLSNLSPYLHFGQVSQKRVVSEVIRRDRAQAAVYLDELLVRTALAENYCLYCEDYDNSDGFAPWAKKALEEHGGDMRVYGYTLPQLEEAQTHDDIWNFAQNQMRQTGKMHSYLRMYWAKKMLEWCKNAQTAQKWAIYLNDKYELDGTDPNGYAGIAWCLGGVHDRAFGSRPIYGKLRYMSYQGCKRKMG